MNPQNKPRCQSEYTCNPAIECRLWADSGCTQKMCYPFSLVKPEFNSVVQISSCDWYRWDGSAWRTMTAEEQEAMS